MTNFITEVVFRSRIGYRKTNNGVGCGHRPGWEADKWGDLAPTTTLSYPSSVIVHVCTVLRPYVQSLRAALFLAQRINFQQWY